MLWNSHYLRTCVLLPTPSRFNSWYQQFWGKISICHILISRQVNLFFLRSICFFTRQSKAMENQVQTVRKNLCAINILLLLWVALQFSSPPTELFMTGELQMYRPAANISRSGRKKNLWRIKQNALTIKQFQKFMTLWTVNATV